MPVLQRKCTFDLDIDVLTENSIDALSKFTKSIITFYYFFQSKAMQIRTTPEQVSATLFNELIKSVESLFSKMNNASKKLKFQQFINSNGKTKIDSSDSVNFDHSSA